MSKEEIMEVLHALAEKFGTTTEFLWTVMIKQAYITGITHLIGFTLSGIFIFAWNRYVWSMKIPDSEEDRGGDRIFGIMITRLMGVVGACLWVMIFLCGLVDITTSLVNPEYWVLKQIFGGVWK